MLRQFGVYQPGPSANNEKKTNVIKYGYTKTKKKLLWLTDKCKESKHDKEANSSQIKRSLKTHKNYEDINKNKIPVFFVKWLKLKNIFVFEGQSFFITILVWKTYHK